MKAAIIISLIALALITTFMLYCCIRIGKEEFEKPSAELIEKIKECTERKNNRL